MINRWPSEYVPAEALWDGYQSRWLRIRWLRNHAGLVADGSVINDPVAGESVADELMAT